MADRPGPLRARRQAVGAAVRRPRAVGVASGLWLVAIVTGVVGESIGLYLARRIMRQAIMLVDPGESQATVLPPAYAGPNISSALFDLLLFGVTAVTVFAFRDGAHWSRATLTALGALIVLDRLCLTGFQAALYLAIGPGGRTDLVFAGISVVAVLVAVPVMYSAATSRYLRGS